MSNCLTVDEIWICPPLAFARFGQSPFPMENFHWKKNDYSPRGTAETVIEPSLTFNIDATGNISAYLPEKIQFKDGPLWRPVCPFFELHARFSDGSEGPLDLNKLQETGISLSNVTWQVEAANRKAYHYTLSPGDKVEASVTVSAADHRKVSLSGTSPAGSTHSLVPEGFSIPLGQVQAIRPNPTWPELRLRITPPQGLIYGPSNSSDRDLNSLVPGTESRAKFLRHIQCILNPDAAWPNWKLNGDPRTNPGGLYAQDPNRRSLGFIDDSNDGLITVTVTGAANAGGRLSATARYTCCPQDFQPDRRPFVSIADGLADFVKRNDVFDPNFVGGGNWPETEAEIADLMQRVRETMEASNLDHQNLRSKLGNDSINGDPPVPPGEFPFEPIAPRPGHPLPLTEDGRAHHARFLAYEVFKQRLGQRPHLFEEWIRNPTAAPNYYNKQMPTVMRGSDSLPMSLSQRQYFLLKNWLDYIRQTNS